MNAPDPNILSKLIRKLEKNYGDRGAVGCVDLIDHTSLSGDPLISELVFSMLLWEASIEHAIKAVERIGEGLVDLNELRVCTSEEVAGVIGARYPRSIERAHRLITTLNTIFTQENHLSLVHLREMNKREVLEYFASIDGLPPYVISRIILLGLGWHAFPIDDRLTRLLAGHGVTDTSLDIDQQSQRMERMVRANESLSYYTLIEHWSQHQRRSKTTTPKSATRKSRSKSNTPKSTLKGSS